MTDNELKITATCIQALVSQQDSELKIETLLRRLLASYKNHADLSVPHSDISHALSDIITFSKKEISHMHKTFKKEFIANGLIAHVIKRKRGKNAFIYEIRYRRNGFNIRVSSADFDTAKRKFLELTSSNDVENFRKKQFPGAKNSFRNVSLDWLEFRKGNLNECTHKNYASYCKRFLFPSIGDMIISQIKTLDLKKIMATVQGRVYEDLRVVLNSVFKYALANGLISNNPMLLIPFKKAERNNRRSLTNDELKKLFERLNLPEFKDYKQTFLILLFFGLRPCELADARFEEDFLIARNAKRKAGKIEYKKIPICNQARELLDLSAPIKALHRTDVLNRIFKRIMNDDDVTQYYLRHTFATVCQQYVRPDIVDIWMGDSSERLVGRVYTHFSDDFMLKQMQKVVFDF